jgi:ubiquinone/menaquinone biosynthesis C-methylase UbiE
MKKATSLVKQNGYFVCAIYNKHLTSKIWKLIKWLYCMSPSFVKILFVAVMYPLIFIAKFMVTWKNPFNQTRGMDFYFNVIDWVGGYPYEYASQKELIEIVNKQGFCCIKKIPAEVPTGCNEYVFMKVDDSIRNIPDNKEIYNENWVVWEDIKKYGPMSRHTQRLVRNICRKISFSSMCDVGCGPGVFLSVMKKSFNNVKLAGTDISSTAIALAKGKFPDSDFFEVDISKGTIEGSWDLVTMIDVAEHIENDEAAFSNIRNFCKKYLLVVSLEGTMRPFEPQIGHVRNYKRGELQEKLIRSGYAIVSSKNWGWPMYSPLYRNLSQAIDAHKKPMTFIRKIMTHIVYGVLACNLPQKGDIIVVLAKPDYESKQV